VIASLLLSACVLVHILDSCHFEHPHTVTRPALDWTINIDPIMSHLPHALNRLDIRRYGSLSSHFASRGHFPMVVVGYAVGLMVANFAVSYFEVTRVPVRAS
jgi:hypothetical protein